ncbi:hypothetical protein EDB85DRAFT_598883 [Lactarius pseudohatsudake]|nr:hypothetical protein EDB85DRAFT_598883 [Lactarius pseudohatsudake]
MLGPLVTHLLHFELFLRDRQRLTQNRWLWSGPLHNRLFYPATNGCSMAHGSHDPCAWTRLALIPSLPPCSTFVEIGNIDPTHGCLAAPNDLPVYLLLVQSHLRKSCLWACMELGMDEGDGVIGDEEGANATLHHCCITLVLTASCRHLTRTRMVRSLHTCSAPCSVLPFCPLKCMGSHTADRLCHSCWCVHRLYPLFHCAHSEPSISMRPLHTFTLAVHFAARSSPTGERRPCHVRLLPHL